MKIRIAYTQPGDSMKPIGAFVFIPEADLIIVLLDRERAGAQEAEESLTMWNRLYKHLDVIDPRASKPVPPLRLVG